MRKSRWVGQREKVSTSVTSGVIRFGRGASTRHKIRCKRCMFAYVAINVKHSSAAFIVVVNLPMFGAYILSNLGKDKKLGVRF
jgi:hypothetical protein